MFFFSINFPANAAPSIEPVSGLVEVSGEQLLYLEVGRSKSFRVNGSDDGAFTYAINSTIANVQKDETGTQADLTLTLDNTAPQSLR